MKWRPMEFRQRRSDAPADFEAKHMIQSEINRSYKRPVKICSPSSMRMETVSLITYDDFTTWLSTPGGSRGQSSQNEHGPNSAVKARGPSLPKNTQQSSLQKR